ncbi:MAG: proprotein convertase P-domain-containing protein [Phycisphaerales bacterium]|nr:proprotein convertase P-domain-containing protein [Planctomycetota bacterium]MCH8509271.1 proprotein convertase P-domain-containing protein [Phycisphaerales bacterium]
MRLLGAVLLCLSASAGASGSDACATTPVAIPDFNAQGVVAPIVVDAGPGLVVETITVHLGITHPWVGDLVVTLESPSGEVVALLDRPGIPSTGFPGPFGCGGRDINAIFADDASVAAEDICSYAARPVITGTVRPNGSLSAFHGQPASGTWLLRLYDLQSYDVGTLTQACLQITTAPACPADINGDGKLNFFDFAAFITLFNAGDPAADINGDGELNFFDVAAYLNLFNAGCP